MDVNIGAGLDMPAQTVMTGRGCVIGQSGSGKSYMVGVIAEELCRLNLPFVIVDTEGEYGSLKEKFNIIVAGTGEDADVQVSQVDYGRLFLESMENNVAIVLDVSESPHAADLVYGMLKALYAVEEKRRMPYLVIIEEADKFVPQVVHPAPNMVEEISFRGRKRGIGLLLATQRPAGISKNVLAQCSYGFIGRLSTEGDLQAVGPLLGERRRLGEIPGLAPGHFVPFGLQFKDAIAVKKRVAEPEGATPTLKDYGRKVVKIGKILDELKRSMAESERIREEEREGRAVNGYVVEYSHTADGARAYAAGLLKKEFVLFGRAVERIDAVTLKYVQTSLLKVRVPKARRNEYDERYVWFRGIDHVSARDGQGFRFIGSGVARPSKLGEEERAVLCAIISARGATVGHILSATSMKDGAINAALGKLRRKGLVNGEKGVFSTAFADVQPLAAVPISISMSIDQGRIINREPSALAAAEKLAAEIYPCCKVVSADCVYIPVYEITLRKNSEVRMFSIDACYGKDISV